MRRERLPPQIRKKTKKKNGGSFYIVNWRMVVVEAEEMSYTM